MARKSRCENMRFVVHQANGSLEAIVKGQEAMIRLIAQAVVDESRLYGLSNLKTDQVRQVKGLG